jgi:hypothetical protein
MQSSPQPAGQDGHFIPLATLPGWTRAMHQASRAQCLGQVSRAAGWYREALGLAFDQVETGRTDNEDACLCALVSSTLCLSGLQVDQGHLSLAAATLADAHTTLVRLMLGQPRASAWRKAAVWYSHDTHAALVSHWEAHGPDPMIEGALRAGCLVMNATAPAVH